MHICTYRQRDTHEHTQYMRIEGVTSVMTALFNQRPVGLEYANCLEILCTYRILS